MSGAEPLLPAALTENDYMVVPGEILSRKEIPAELRLDPQDWKQICGDAECSDYLRGLTGFRQTCIAKGIGAYIPIGSHLATKVDIVRTRDAPLRVLRSHPIQSLELLAFRVGKRL